MTRIPPRRPAIALLGSVLLAQAACRPSGSGDAPAASTTTAPSTTTPTPTTPTPTTATPSPMTTTNPGPGPSDAEMAADARGERAFAARLHTTLVKTPAGAGNLFVSPASVRFAFAMLHAGAKGTTESELAKTFGYGPRTADVAASLADSWAQLGVPAKEEWQRGQEVTVKTANRIFAARTITLRPEYLAVTRDRFAAPVDLLDFANDAEGARKHINRFVEESTAGRIKEILAKRMLSSATKLALANAIYFKAAWQKPFEAHLTKPGPFTTPNGKVDVPMMTQLEPGKVGDTADAEVVELAYGRDFVMTIVLPKAPATLASIERDLTDEKLRTWASAPVPVRMLRVTLPRFRVESTLGLGETLQALGVESAFVHGKADFSGIDGTRDLFVSTAIHKTFVAVDEKGTEAAAATVVGLEMGAAPDPKKPREVVVDRPFLFAIRDAKRDRLVFLGRVTDPSK